MKKENNIVVVKVDASEIEQEIKKVKRLMHLLQEANSLAKELTSKELNITLYM